MNAFIILAAIVAIATASTGTYKAVHNGPGHFINDASGNTVEVMGVDQNKDGLPDFYDTNRDGRVDKKGYGHGFGYGKNFGYGRGYGSTGYGSTYGRGSGYGGTGQGAGYGVNNYGNGFGYGRDSTGYGNTGYGKTGYGKTGVYY